MKICQHKGKKIISKAREREEAQRKIVLQSWSSHQKGNRKCEEPTGVHETLYTCAQLKDSGRNLGKHEVTSNSLKEHAKERVNQSNMR